MRRLTRRARATLALALALSIWSPVSPALTARTQSPPQIFLKLDFDAVSSPFTAAGNAEATLVDGSSGALGGQSLMIRRATPGGFFGAIAPMRIDGSSGLRIAFVVRAQGMHSVGVNVFDERQQDNTTPASPARISDEGWRTVVLAVDDFHYNSNRPDQKISGNTTFASLLFHGRENGPSATIWIDKLVIYRGRDDAPPEPPATVRAAADADGAVALSWQEPSDNLFAVTYSIERKNDAGAWEKIGESLRPAYQDRGAPSGARTYRITAADYENNVSAPSAEVTAEISSAIAAPRGAAVPPPAPVVVDRLNYAANVREIHARGNGRMQRDVFLFAGDSITAAARYTHILGSWLARGRTVRQGVGTITTAFGAANIARYVAESRPEFAVVMYGTNDQGHGDSISGSMRNLASIVDVCTKAGVVPILATIPPRGFNARSQGGQERYNKALAELARQKQIPVSYAFEEMIKDDLRNVLMDGIHLTPERGNDLAGRALRQTMDQVYFALRETSGAR